MNRARHIGIVAVSAEGAALCYRTICTEGAAVLGPHDHPQVTMHTYPLAEYMQHVEAIRFTRLWISCTRRRPHRGFISPKKLRPSLRREGSNGSESSGRAL